MKPISVYFKRDGKLRCAQVDTDDYGIAVTTVLDKLKAVRALALVK